MMLENKMMNNYNNLKNKFQNKIKKIMIYIKLIKYKIQNNHLKVFKIILIQNNQNKLIFKIIITFLSVKIKMIINNIK